MPPGNSHMPANFCLCVRWAIKMWPLSFSRATATTTRSFASAWNSRRHGVWHQSWSCSMSGCQAVQQPYMASSGLQVNTEHPFRKSFRCIAHRQAALLRPREALADLIWQCSSMPCHCRCAKTALQDRPLETEPTLTRERTCQRTMICTAAENRTLCEGCWIALVFFFPPFGSNTTLFPVRFLLQPPNRCIRQLGHSNWKAQINFARLNS